MWRHQSSLKEPSRILVYSTFARRGPYSRYFIQKTHEGEKKHINKLKKIHTFVIPNKILEQKKWMIKDM
jgi:hypothetical protein